MQQSLKALTHALQLKIDGIGLQANHTTESESDQSSTVSIWAAVCACWEKRDPTCLVTTCTLAVAGRGAFVAGQKEMNEKES